MAVDVDEIAAVAAQLKEAQCQLLDLELACELQRQEFFGDESGSSASESDDPLRQVLELEVVELTAQLQALTDARLAWETHQEALLGASQAACDRRLAAAIGDTCDEGPSGREVEALAHSLPQGSRQAVMRLHLSFAAAVQGEEPCCAGCGALVTAGGDVLWQSGRSLQLATRRQAQFTAAVMGLQAVGSLGLASSMEVVLECSDTAALHELERTGEAHSSTLGPLVEEAQLLLSRLPAWSSQRASGTASFHAEQLALQALMKPPSSTQQDEQAAQKGALVSPVSPPLTSNDTCGICLDSKPAPLFHVIGACLHRYCSLCLQRHAQTVIRGRTYPVRCPDVGCPGVISSPECELLLSSSSTDLAMYRQVEAEASIPDNLRLYCPNPRCSQVIVLDEEPTQDSPLVCPACDTKLCAWCNTVWHKGFSCREYQELPASERQPEDVALLDEARRRRWQRCSQCRRMIELFQGCRHMTCTCGHEFCYTCGKPWWADKAAGTRICTCDLFDPAPALAEEPHAQEDAGEARRALDGVVRQLAAAELDPDAVPVWVPQRVRPVFRTELCMYHSSGECQRGNRCWFAHGRPELREPRAGGSRPLQHGGSDSDSDSD